MFGQTRRDYLLKQLVPSLHLIAEPHDIIILNFGLWYNDAPEFRQVMLDFEVSWREIQRNLPYLMAWRETSPQHFPLSEVSCSAWLMIHSIITPAAVALWAAKCMQSCALRSHHWLCPYAARLTCVTCNR